MPTVPITSSSVVGIPSKSAWATTATWHVGATTEHDSAEIFAVFSCSGSDQAPHLGRHLVAELSSHSDTSLADFHTLLTQKIASVSDEATLSLALIWRTEFGISLLGFGGARIALQRRQAGWRWLCDGQSESQVLQGKLVPGDVFVLETAIGSDLEGFPQDVVTDVEMTAMQLMPMVQRFVDQGELAIQLLQFSDPDAEADLSSPPATRRLSLGSVNRSLSQAQAAAEEVPDLPASSTSSQLLSASPSHLITPARISEGITKAQVRSPRHSRLPGWWKVFKWERKPQENRISIVRVLAVVALIGAVVGLIFGVRIWRVRDEHEKVLLPLKQLTQEVQAIPDTERFVKRDAAKSLLERLEATQVSFRTNQREIQTLVAQVQPIYEAAAAETNLVNLATFFDFRLVDQGFLAGRASREQNEVVFLDTSQSRALHLDLDSKRSGRVDLGGVTQPQDVSISSGLAFWMTPTQAVQTALTGTDPKVITNWINGREPQFLERFGDNVYALDTEAGQIWRASTAEVASPSAWIRSARGVDLPSVTSMAIDGEIWLGSSQGDVYRLARGERLDFAISGLLEPLTSSLLLAVTADGTTLAVVEPARQRIVFVNKQTGEYLRQVRSPQIGAVTDVFWGPGETQLYLVAGSVVYRVE